MNQTNLTAREGIVDGMPIFIGYFPTAIAFGLVCRNAGLFLWESTFSSLAVYGGSSQFLGVNLLVSGAAILEIVLSMALVNLRYAFEGAAVARKLDNVHGLKRFIVGFFTTDEVFSISVLKGKPLGWGYMVGLELTAYTGWVSGTVVGCLVGAMLSDEWQLAVGVTLYAMFSAMWAGEVRKGGARILFVGLGAGLANSALSLGLHVGAGWSFVISMLGATFVGALCDGGTER